MDFNGDYWNALDQASELKYRSKDIGISHGIGDVGEGLKTNIFRGASLVELGWFGQGKGFRSQPTGHTPESYGSDEREEMRQLAKINEIDVTTHASPNIGYSSGFNEGAFRPEARENVLQEVQRAVHFAADVAEGGPVVMHVGEFQRPVFEAEDTFEQYPGERKKAPLYTVDERTGKVNILSREQQIAVPEKVDKYGNPVRNSETGVIDWKMKSVYELEQEALKLKKDPVQYIYDDFLKKEIQLTKSEEQRFMSVAKQEKSKYDELNESIEDFEKIENKTRRDAAAFLKFQKEVGREFQPGSEEYNQFREDPVELLKNLRDSREENMHAYDGLAASYSKRTKEMEQDIKNYKPIQEYGVTQSAQTIARAGMYAYELEKKKNLEKPLWIAPENWAPELYGSHPKELKNIIQKSRGAMSDMLQEKKGMGESEAKKVADDHIKATFDIGHMNFWKKYFKGSDDEFKQWMDREVKHLVKEGIIGHVHLHDNFGYNDEHLSPGQGNVPIQQFLKNLQEGDYKGKIIAELGGQREGQFHRPWTEALKMAGSPMYRIDGISQSWTDMEQNYFGRAPQVPYFVVGDFAPSKDWTLWSETPLE